eukprot:TRINITY_DN1127_c4_g1_i2.p2 TRINITY_DN1127_c4_g1~~TRINITY_DN1127_c4_g1_i2.p2  ORF type:complete len:109 (-),score=7.74 TRINITY_DN1127_c4_g1_i2:31-357(-)
MQADVSLQCGSKSKDGNRSCGEKSERCSQCEAHFPQPRHHFLLQKPLRRALYSGMHSAPKTPFGIHVQPRNAQRQQNGSGSHTQMAYQPKLILAGKEQPDCWMISQAQ